MKSIYLFCWFYLFFTSHPQAQSTFSKRYHFDLNAVVLTGVEQVSDSTYLIMGIARDTIPPYLVSSISVLIDGQGNSLHENILRNPLRTVEAVAQDKRIDDRIYKLGYSIEPGVGTKALLISYALDGEPLWEVYQQDFRDTATFFRFNDMVVSNDKIYATGNNSYVGEGDNWWGAVLAIYNTEGQLVGGFVYEDPLLRTWSRAIKQVDDNLLLIGGVRDNYNRTWNNYQVMSKLWAVDTLGNLLWTWQSDENELQQGIRDMALAPDGGLVIATAIGEEFPINDEAGIVYWDHCILKLNANQEEEWRTLIGSQVSYDYNSYHRIIGLADNSGYVATGFGLQYYPDADPLTGNVWDYGGLVSKVAANGDSLWARIIIDPTVDSLSEYHECLDLIETSDGGFFVVGEAYTPHPTLASQQGWLLKLDEWGCLVPGCELVSAVTEADGPRFKLLLYPNPVRDQLSVYLGPGELPTGSTWTIYNTAGQLLDQHPARMADATYLLPVAGWQAGNYWLQLRGPTGELLAQEQFVVMK
ncbi:T9SS type A sorting domain-containing protein [Lewinella cohaerens]|uniref:T9SS type A sorting domain-containing protein n=1 Tax=Lewinella cohaerens TaxID=70995 RepID=UPI00036D4037|nr:T9SS type A sorting domain-containing protein [Lewinella cohaerens]